MSECGMLCSPIKVLNILLEPGETPFLLEYNNTDQHNFSIFSILVLYSLFLLLNPIFSFKQFVLLFEGFV